MNSQDFDKRLSQALEKIESLLKRHTQQNQQRLLEVCDTGAGGGEHSYRIEQRRRFNGKIEQMDQFSYTNIQAILDKLSTVKDVNELWSYIYSEVRATTLCGSNSISGHNNRGIDWRQAWTYFSQRPQLPHAEQGLEARLQALHIVYQTFWL